MTASGFPRIFTRSGFRPGFFFFFRCRFAMALDLSSRASRRHAASVDLSRYVRRLPSDALTASATRSASVTLRAL